MPNKRGVSVHDCPLKLEVCFPSCHWWKEEKCTYPKPDLGTEKQVAELKAMRFKD